VERGSTLSSSEPDRAQAGTAAGDRTTDDRTTDDRTTDDPAAGQTRVPGDELAARLAAVQAAMGRRSLAALVVSDPANLYYLTGYDAWSFYTPQCLVVPGDGEPVLFARAMDAAGAHYTCSLPPQNVYGYPEALVHRPDRHPYDWICAQARELGLLCDDPDATVAVEGDSAYFPVRGYLALAAGLPRARWVDSAELVNWVRLVKSDYECNLLRVAGRIAEEAMAAALDAIAVGRRQCDVAAEILSAQASGTAEHGGDYPAIVPMLPTGEAAGTPHLTWTDRRFVDGEATTIELAGAYRRYHAPLARTVMLGAPPDRLARTADVLTEALPATLAAMTPGTPGRVVHDTFDGFLRRHRLHKESRIGYSIGIGYPPDWGERTVSLRTEEETELVAGMAFHVILGMWMDGWGYEVSEPVIVTDHGAERLTGLSQTLTTKR
jgi:ectoine hydrolase